MQTEVKNLGKLKRELAITVPIEVMQTTANKVYQDLKNKISIKGFRKGKFPKNLMEKRFFEDIAIEVKNTIIPEYLNKAIQKHLLKVVTKPQIDSKKIEKNNPFLFRASFEVFPEFKMPNWEEVIQIKKFELNLQEKEIANYALLTSLQNYDYKEQNELVEKSNRVQLKLEFQEIAQKQEQRETTIFYYVDSNELSPELDKALLQMKVKEKKELELVVSPYSLSRDIAGKQIKLKIEVLSITRKVDAPKNKEFYQKIALEVVDEKSLLDFSRKSLANMKKKQNDHDEQKLVQEAIIKNVNFDVPEELFNSKIQQILQQDKQNIDKKNQKELEKNTIDSLRYQFVLAQMIAEHKISVPQQELSEAIASVANSYNIKPDQLLASDHSQNIIDSIRNQMEEEKVLNFICKSAQRI